MNQFNDKQQYHGYWEWYHSNGNISWKGNFINGKEDGYWEDYWANGNLDYKGNFINGRPIGYWEWYHYCYNSIIEKAFYL
jgi:antitoxin component YwqK of YwqJK toxin-antitoxin module